MKRHSRSLVGLIREFFGGTDMTLVGAEIGVWRGHTSQALLSSFPNLFLHCVDPWEGGGEHATMPKTVEEMIAARQEFWRLTDFADKRRFTYRNTSRDAAKILADGSFDFCFIDGEHIYDSVREDIFLWHPKVRSGGLLCGHDYNGVGDRRGSGVKFGVKRAVDEFALENGYEVGVAPNLIWWWRK